MVARRKRHHWVSKGLQRSFALDGVERITVLQKNATAQPWTSHIYNVFVRSDFCSYEEGDGGDLADELEDEWQKREGAALPNVRAWNSGSELPASRDAAIQLACIHFARSLSLDIVRERAADEIMAEPLEDWLDLERIRENWEVVRDEPLTYAALRPEVLAEMDMFGLRSAFRAHGMALMHDACGYHLQELEVNALRPSSRAPDFILPDVPLVLSDLSGLNVGVRDGVKLREADRMFMSLGRRFGVEFTRAGGRDRSLGTVDVQRINRLGWRGAINQVAYHPDTDIDRALGMRVTG